MFTWDEAKRLSTLQTRGIDFADAERLDFATALIRPDIRHDYGEPRFRALAMLDGRLHAVVFTPRDGVLRLISLRYANARERRRWANAKT